MRLVSEVPYEDWRDLWSKPFIDPNVVAGVDRLARRIVNATHEMRLIVQPYAGSAPNFDLKTLPTALTAAIAAREHGFSEPPVPYEDTGARAPEASSPREIWEQSAK